MKRRYRQPQPHKRIATLGNLAARGFTLERWCGRCVRYTEIPAADLAARLGPEVLITQAGQGSQCPSCGSTAITVMPGSPPLLEI